MIDVAVLDNDDNVVNVIVVKTLVDLPKLGVSKGVERRKGERIDQTMRRRGSKFEQRPDRPNVE